MMNLYSTLTIISIIIFAFHHQPTAVSASSRVLPELQTVQSPVYKQLCNKTQTASFCESVVKSDNRGNLKSSPEGLAVIFVDAAKRNVITTTDFLNIHLKNTTDADTVQGLKNCQQGYRITPLAQLNNITVERLRDDGPERRKVLSQALGDMAGEVFYDCTWFQPNPYPQLLNIMAAKENIFDRLIQMATTMIDLIK